MVDVRRAHLKDLDALGDLFDQYRVFYLQDSDQPAARAFIESRMKADESIIFIAIQDKKSIGFTQLFPSFSSVSMRRLWVLNDLFVQKEFRKKRVAQALIHEAEKFAKENGAIGLTLKTARSNDPAQALYDKLGWKRDEQFVSYNLRFKP